MKLSDKYDIGNVNEGKGVDYIWNSPFSRFLIDWMEYKVNWKSNSLEEGRRLWLDVRNSVPIYYIKWTWWYRKWAYVKEKNIILVFDNTDDETLKHEIVHSIEFNRPISQELEKFYELVKLKITEESFDDGVVSFNFRKNIHEFIADWYSKKPFVDALRKEWLYREFLIKTEYIFE